LIEWMETHSGSYQVLLGVASVLLSLWTSVHILRTRRDTRAAIGWMGVVWLSPFLGVIAYRALGVNRVRRAAVRMLASKARPRPARAERANPGAFAHLDQAAERFTRRPLLAGNAVELMRDGDQTYPEMLDAIRTAKHSVGLQSYIFYDDQFGEQFVQALIDAKDRGVDVRVMVDGVGSWRSKVIRRLRRAGVQIRVFLPVKMMTPLRLLNLRNHRKLMIVDGVLAYTGGTNIHDGTVFRSRWDGDTHDVHFRVRGPVVGQLRDSFAVDWAFVGGHPLSGQEWFPPLKKAGSRAARAIPDGPDEDLDVVAEVFFAAVNEARRDIFIVTPYFLPEAPLLAALRAAAARGVRVRVVQPEHNNPNYMSAAAASDLRWLALDGVEIGFLPGAFEHSKLLVVDGRWCCVGSANWDPRSLRLNFELNLEVHSEPLADAIYAVYQNPERPVRWCEPHELQAPSELRELSRRFIRLFKPYL